LEPPATSSKTPSVLQLVLGILSFGLSVLSALGMVVISLAARQVDDAAVNTFRYMTLIVLAIGISAIPSIVLAIRRISLKPEKLKNKRNTFLITSICLVVLAPLALLLKLPFFTPTPAWLMALANVLFVAIPAWWFIELGSLRLSPISRQKTWGIFNFSAFVSMPVIIFIEGLLLVIGATGFMVWLSNRQEYATLVDQLKNLMYIKIDSVKLLMDQYGSLMQEPSVIAMLVLVIALIVPLVEELLKPLAIWFFIKRKWSPREGFIAGMICGGAFAVVESLISLASADSGSWLPLVAARSGTALLHIVTAGLSGWALTSSWLDGKYLRVGITYVVTVFIHGIWNFLAITVGVGSFANESSLDFIKWLSPAAPWMMAGLVVILIGLLILINTSLRKQQTSLTPPQLPPPLPE
jgi:hypothetical protein